MHPQAIPQAIERLLAIIEATDGQKALARSLSLAASLAVLIDTPPAQLLRDLQPAADLLAARDALLRDAVEVRR